MCISSDKFTAVSYKYLIPIDGTNDSEFDGSEIRKSLTQISCSIVTTNKLISIMNLLIFYPNRNLPAIVNSEMLHEINGPIS